MDSSVVLLFSPVLDPFGERAEFLEYENDRVLGGLSEGGGCKRFGRAGDYVF